LAVDANVIGVLQQRQHILDERLIRFGRVLEGHQHFAGHSIPVPPPLLVYPADTEEKRSASSLDEIVQRPVEKAASVEPVVVVAERVDAVSSRQLELLIRRIGKAQIVVAERAWLPRLQVAGPERPGCRYVAPVGEAFAPPAVVLGDRMK